MNKRKNKISPSRIRKRHAIGRMADFLFYYGDNKLRISSNTTKIRGVAYSFFIFHTFF